MYFCRENIHKDYKVKSYVCYLRELPWFNRILLIREHKNETHYNEFLSSHVQNTDMYYNIIVS